MVVDISDVLLNIGSSKQYTVSFEADKFSYRMGDYQVTEANPLVLTVVSNARNKLHISGEGKVILNIPCARCLSDVNTEVDFDIDEELSLDDEEDDEAKDFVTGHFLDAEKFLYSEILINVPTKVLCKDDCQGICSVCGHNLNEGDCGCDRFVPDPRMSAINDIFAKFSK